MKESDGNSLYHFHLTKGYYCVFSTADMFFLCTIHISDFECTFAAFFQCLSIFSTSELVRMSLFTNRNTIIIPQCSSGGFMKETSVGLSKNLYSHIS